MGLFHYLEKANTQGLPLPLRHFAMFCRGKPACLPLSIMALNRMLGRKVKMGRVLTGFFET
jgi:hypothetical protein